MGTNVSATRSTLGLRSWEIWKRFLVLVLPGLALLAGGLLFLRARDRARDRSLIGLRARDLTRIQAEFTAREFEKVEATLLHFSRQGLLRRFLDEPAERARLEDEYMRLAASSRDFDQVRVIDLAGREVLRVNYDGEAPAAVPTQDLQSKQDRYYFRQARGLPAGHVYVSPIDLNQEHGRIEEPWKPVVRMATPVFDELGTRRGILVFNYLARHLFARLDEVSSQVPGWTGIVDGRGYYLEGPSLDRSWRSLFGDEPSFAADHPTAWAVMQSQSDGTLTTDAGLFTYQAVARAGGSDPLPSMVVVSYIPLAAVYERSSHTFTRLAAVALAVVVLLSLVALRLAFVSAQRDAHEREIAGSERRLRILSRRLLDSQEAERKGLSRDLHDGLGQIATALTIDLKSARRAPAADSKDECIERGLAATSRLMDELHRITARVRSTPVEDLGLEAALRACADELAGGAGLRVEIEADFAEHDLNESICENVYRVFQEALTNTTRHARAREFSVRIWQREARLELFVRDDGVGFEPRASAAGRLGLLGMRERVELLGGTFLVRSAPGRGTSIEASIPLEAEEFEA